MSFCKEGLAPGELSAGAGDSYGLLFSFLPISSTNWCWWCLVPGSHSQPSLLQGPCPGASPSPPYTPAGMLSKGRLVSHCPSPLKLLWLTALKKEAASQWMGAGAAFCFSNHWLAAWPYPGPVLGSPAHHEAFRPIPGWWAYGMTQADLPLTTFLGLGF